MWTIDEMARKNAAAGGVLVHPWGSIVLPYQVPRGGAGAGRRVLRHVGETPAWPEAVESAGVGP